MGAVVYPKPISPSCEQGGRIGLLPKKQSLCSLKTQDQRNPELEIGKIQHTILMGRILIDHTKLSFKLSICKSGANREEMDDVLYT